MTPPLSSTHRVNGLGPLRGVVTNLLVEVKPHWTPLAVREQIAAVLAQHGTPLSPQNEALLLASALATDLDILIEGQPLRASPIKPETELLLLPPVSGG